MSEYEHQYTGTLPVLPVADVAETLEYYLERLGFESVFFQNGPDGSMINAQVQMDGCHLMLNLNPDRAGERGGGVYFWIRVKQQSVDQLYQRLQTSGVKIVEPIADQFWGDRSFVVEDGEGFLIAFTQKLDDSG